MIIDTKLYCAVISFHGSGNSQKTFRIVGAVDVEVHVELAFVARMTS